MSISSTKIKSFKLYKAKAKLKKPVADATHTLHEISFLVLQLQLENGVSGESYLLSFQYSPHAIAGTLKDILPATLGYEAFETGRLQQLIANQTEYFGQNGINKWAAAVNIAMWDANQRMQLPEAIQLIRKAVEMNIYWFEEPLHHQNFDGYKSLKTQTGISLTMGEREYDTLPLLELNRRNALDIRQPNMLRIDGVKAWRASAAIANAHHIPVLPHYYKDYDVPLVCSVSIAAKMLVPKHISSRAGASTLLANFWKK